MNIKKMRKLLAITILAITLSCASDSHVDKCMEINAKYDKLVGQAGGDHDFIASLEKTRNIRLREAGCIK